MGEKLKPKDPDYWPAVAAAIVDLERAEWVPGADEEGRPEPGHYQFTRAHVQLLHDLGCTRAQVLAYAAQIYNRAQLAKFETDLHTYGEWV